MSDRMNPLKIDHLLTIVLNELKQNNSIFGIPKHSFFYPQNHPELSLRRFGQLLETPFGVAAGPQTQLAQNIISAYLTGSRYIELKTVQTLDQIEVSKPCIDMEDQGFNCEWSQELNLDQSFNEYLNAWIVVHILKKELGFNNGTNELGCIFNMSCGYNLEGIKNENMQRFLARMENCETELKEKLEIVRKIYPAVDELNIPSRITDNITLSTMHGCPPDEIEKIGMYLLTEKHLHTTIKLNPTLNGPEDLRGILNGTLGFTDTVIPDIAFEHDLKYPDGVKLIRNLKNKAKELNLFFGLKLTNTLESVNNKDNFDKSNAMMYMSGRPLHALAINLANKLQREFDGDLDLTFSSGADAFNVMHVLACDIRPITVSSDLLKPGGYERTYQYIGNTLKHMELLGAKNLLDIVKKTANKGECKVCNFLKGICGKGKTLQEMRLQNIADYLPRVLNDPRYHKEAYPWNLIKTDRVLPKFDCIQAPCSYTCPTNQDIPGYMHLVATGNFEEALKVIRNTNPFPNATGVACDHICEDKCSRLNYDDTLHIRDIKRFAASKEAKVETLTPKRELDKTVAIVGGGPSGLSAAYFLGLEGFKVEVFEAKTAVGGMITHALPNFRTSTGLVEKDINRIKSLGVVIHENSKVDATKFKELKASFDYVYVAIGAQLSKKLGVPGEDVEGIVGHLEFLEDAKLGKLVSLPKNVLVIGGGNSAIDCIRTAKRLVGNDGKATMIYRRTVKEMPANREEIEELFEENIDILELTAPKEVISKDGHVTGLKCVKMELGEPDASGRRRPVEIAGSEFIVDADYIVKSIGQDIDSNFLSDILEITPRGTIKNESLVAKDNVLTGGDVSRGPASIIKAVADGKNAAFSIMRKEGIEVPTFKKVEKNKTRNEIKLLRRERIYGTSLPKACSHCRDDLNIQVVKTFSDDQAMKEASRCLMCDELCDVCVTVCPNRANVGYDITPVNYSVKNITVKDGKATEGTAYKYAINQKHQVMNIGDFCNECGNCRAFCPSAGFPAFTKPKMYIDEEFFNAEDRHAYMVKGNSIIFKTDDAIVFTLTDEGESFSFTSKIADFRVNKADFKVTDIKANGDGEIDMREVVGMQVLYDAMKKQDYLLKR